LLENYFLSIRLPVILPEIGLLTPLALSKTPIYPIQIPMAPILPGA
jgi:hypothetical protein